MARKSTSGQVRDWRRGNHLSTTSPSLVGSGCSACRWGLHNLLGIPLPLPVASQSPIALATDPEHLVGCSSDFFHLSGYAGRSDACWTPVVAASLMAFVPRSVFLSAYVTNDSLVNLLAAVLTYLALAVHNHPPDGESHSLVGSLAYSRHEAFSFAAGLDCPCSRLDAA